LQLMSPQRAGQQDPTGTLCTAFFGSAMLQDPMSP
jgi:hypothetical protein